MADEERGAAQTIKFPVGVDNRSREYELADGALRVCENLDVTRSGGLVSRLGTRAVAAGEFHSPFVHPSQKFMLVVKDNVLQRMDRDENLTAITAVSSFVSYAVLNDEVFWTDGEKVGRVLPTGATALWGMPTPPLPVVTAVSSGGLYAGTYQVAMTAIHSSGLESGAADTVSVEVAEGGGIQVTTPSASGLTFALYRSTANGASDEVRQAAIVAPATTVILGVGFLGRPLESLRVSPPLPGQCMIHHKGRLWVASGKVVWFTDEKSPHWLRPERGYYQFESPVRMLGATEDGVYVGLYDRVYYLQGGDPYDMTQRPVSNEGVASGTGVEIPYDLFLGDGALPSKQAAWWDVDGFFVLGKAGGIVIRPTQDIYSAGSIVRGAIAYRARDGLRQLVAALTAEEATPLIAAEVAVDEVFVNGVTLST